MATQKLTATSLSLSERDSIGDLYTPPALIDQAGAQGFSLDVKARQTRGVPDNKKGKNDLTPLKTNKRRSP